MGFFVDIVVHRGDLGGDPTFAELLRRTKVSATGTYAHRDLPIGRVVEVAALERDPGRDPLFQAMFTLQEPETPTLELSGLTCRTIRIRNTTARSDLSLLLYVEDDGLAGEFEYNTDLFDEATIERMGAHYVRRLEEIARDALRPISRLPFITAAERQGILVDWNRTARAFPGDLPITALLALQAQRAPDSAAVIDGAPTLTYAELDRRARRLAMRVGAFGVAAGATVGVCIERPAGEIVAYLGVLYAGCTYIPIDSTHPPERLAATLKNADAAMIVASADATHGLALATSGSPATRTTCGLASPTRSPICRTRRSTRRPSNCGRRCSTVRGSPSFRAMRCRRRVASRKRSIASV